MDKINFDLAIIKLLFELQLKQDPEQLPWLIDARKILIKGTFVRKFFINSTVDIFNWEKFKADTTMRHEQSQRINVLQSQLEDVKKEALSLIEYYRQYLSNDSALYKQWKRSAKGKSIIPWGHTAFVTIIDKSVKDIYFEVNPNKVNHKYQYEVDNLWLVRYCHENVRFINQLMPEKTEATYREKALAYNYKVEVGTAEPLLRKDMQPKIFEKAFDSLNPKTKSKTNPYREPSLKELNNVILLLQDCPEAQAKAKEALRKVQEAIK